MSLIKFISLWTIIILASSAKVDFIVNGDFSSNLCSKTYCIWNISTYDTSNVYGWLPDPQIQIGKGSFYSQNLGNNKVLELAGSKNTCVKQLIDSLNAGSYDLTVSYAAHRSKKFEDCEFTVYFDNNLVSTVIPSNYAVNNKTFTVKLPKNKQNVQIKFCGSGNFRNDGLSSVLTNVKLQGQSITSLRKQLQTSSQLKISPLTQVAYNPTNLLTNGNLTDNTCKQTYCIWTKSTFKPTFIKGWQPDPEIEIGKGSVYSTKLSSSQYVFQLAANSNTCVKQTLPSLNVGSYQLYFDWAARKDVKDFKQCVFQAYINDQLIEIFVPDDYQVHEDLIDFNVEKLLTKPVIRFCDGKNNKNSSMASVITNFRLYQLEFQKPGPLIGIPSNLNTSTPTINIPTIPNPLASNPLLSTISSTSTVDSLQKIMNTVSSTITQIPSIPQPSVSSLMNVSMPTINVTPIQNVTIQPLGNRLPNITIPVINFNISSSVTGNEVQPQSITQQTKNISQSVEKQVEKVGETKQKPSSQQKNQSKQSILLSSQNSSSKPIQQKSSQSEKVITQLSLSSLPQKQSVSNTSITNKQEVKNKSFTEKKEEPIKNQSFIPVETLKQEPAKITKDLSSVSVNSNDKQKNENKLQDTQNIVTEVRKQNSSYLQTPSKQQQITIQNSSLIAVTNLSQEISSKTNIQPNLSENKLNQSQSQVVSSSVQKLKPTFNTSVSTSSIQQSLKIKTQKNDEQSNSQSYWISDDVSKTTKQLNSISKEATNTVQVISSKDNSVNIKPLQIPKPQNTQQTKIADSMKAMKQEQSSKQVNTQVILTKTVLKSPLEQSIQIQAASKNKSNTYQNMKTQPRQSKTHNSVKNEQENQSQGNQNKNWISQQEQIPLIKPNIPQKPLNLIKNGDFQTLNCSTFPCIINSTNRHDFLSNWIPEPTLQVDLLKSYNTLIPTSERNIVLHLGSSKVNACIKQSLNGLKLTYYDLSFNYGPVINSLSNQISDAFFIVKFNGRNIKNILPFENKLYTENLVVKAIKGENVLEFCSFGSKNTKLQGSFIDNVSLLEKLDLTKMKDDFISNGDFEINDCDSASCQLNQKTFKTSDLTSWNPTSSISIGKGLSFNSHAGISTVVQLISGSCIVQSLPSCIHGSYKLQFSWSLAQNQLAYGSVLQVSLNNNSVQSFIPNDFFIHKQILIIQLQNSKNQLKFCSYGNGGILIDDIKMYLINENCNYGNAYGLTKKQ